ncbi:TPA: ATP-grasp domain-containing protein [Enterobacter hormaechei subsp. xiangfangensis]|nr:ATP-grasp domain-containing protein [Enterobacter hormaechei subsp. xiangfangensis]
MHLVIIGARNTGTSLYLVSLAIKQGMKVIVLTEPHDDLTDAFEKEVKVVYLAISTEVVTEWINKNISCDRNELMITTAHDLYASVAAKVAWEFSVPGPDPRAVDYCVSKFNQDEVISKLGYRKNRSLMMSLDDYVDKLHGMKLEYPLVIKPVEGSASHGIKKCHDYDEALKHIGSLAKLHEGNPKLIPDGKVLLEKFVSGQEYCVEVFDGNLVGLMKKNKSSGGRFIERGYSSDIDLTLSQVENIRLVIESVVKSMGLNWGPVHIDCIINEDDIHIIEVNPRIAGSFITAIIRDAWGVDMSKALLDKLRGRQVSLSINRNPIKFAQVIFFLDSDPDSYNVPNESLVHNDYLSVTYSPQLVPERERRSYIYIIAG